MFNSILDYIDTICLYSFESLEYYYYYYYYYCYIFRHVNKVIISSCSVIVRVSVVLKRTVGDSD